MAKRILIVDDEPLIVKGLKYSLEQDGYETESAADGEEALLDTVKKVQRRYTAYESAVLADNKDVNALTKEERDAYYAKVKAEEKTKGV